ncbi:MAG: hypothetical protein QXR48_00455 [Candidatus Woesearchaeota archaeon]
MIRTLYSMLRNKKGDIPGWAYVIALIIGLFVLLFAIWLIAKAGQRQAAWLEWLR